MNEWLRSVDRTVVCPGCAFTFAEDHTDQDGGYSCPVCAEARLEPALDRARSTACLLEEELARVTAENARLREALAELVACHDDDSFLRGRGGIEDSDEFYERVMQGVERHHKAWAAARAALASPVQEESDG